MPLTKKADGSTETLEERYNKLQDALKEADEDYRQQLYGPQILAGATLEYWELNVCLRLGIEPDRWRRYPLSLRGKLIAHSQLSNELELIERHLSLQHANKKKKGLKDDKGGNDKITPGKA